MKTITASQAQKIIDIACCSWSSKLADLWARSIVLQKDIEVSDQLYKEMRKAADTNQNKILDSIFGKDQPEFKVGDWVVFLPEIAKSHCLYTEGFWDHKRTEPLKIKHIKGTTLEFALEWSNRNICFRLATKEEIEKATLLPDGTPCLVRDKDNDVWSLRYATGKGSFYAFGRKKSGSFYTFKHVFKLDTTQELPVNSEL